MNNEDHTIFVTYLKIVYWNIYEIINFDDSKWLNTCTVHVDIKFDIIVISVFGYFTPINMLNLVSWLFSL